jgi:hypothetical protein
MSIYAIVFGVLTIAYVFVLNFALMVLSGSLKDKLRKQSIIVESNSDVAEMTDSTFWNEIQRINVANPNSLITKALWTRKVLYLVACVLAGLCILSNVLKI